jgi:hypothetical protein
MTPLVSVILLTIGRAHLPTTLASIRDQAPPEACEILCVGDTHGTRWADALAPVPALCRDYQATYLPCDGGLHHYGCPQRTAGQVQARGAWIAYVQDDAHWTPGAWTAIQQSLAVVSPGPRLFRVRTWQPSRARGDEWCTIWDTPVLVQNNVDGDALVVPNRPDQLAPWPATHYASDYDAIAATVALWRGQVRWEPFVLVEGSPHVSGALP